MKIADARNALENHRPGGEPAKSHARRLEAGLLEKYLPLGKILDIGAGEFSPVVPWATIVDIGYPGYDGTHLPFAEGSIDGIFSSHCLEHIPNAEAALKDWFRTLRIGAHLFIVVPHMYLNERKAKPPSSWNAEHLRFFTPGSLLTLVEKALPPNAYRVRLLADNDDGYDYIAPLDEHPRGSYEIEMIIEKIQQPKWPDIWGYRLLETFAARRPGRIAICGAGQIGQYFNELLTLQGYQVACWTDRSKAGQVVDGRTIQTLQDAFESGCTDFVVTIINKGKEVADEIEARARSMGLDVRVHSLAPAEVQQAMRASQIANHDVGGAWTNPPSTKKHFHIRPTATYSPWLDDADFQRVFEKIRHNTLVDRYRCWELWQLVKQAAACDGDILEVGVWRGGTGALIAEAARASGKKVFLADTFEGVVKAGKHDTRYKGGEHADTSMGIVQDLLSSFDPLNVELLKGIFPDETQHLLSNTLALVHCDVDVYTSTKDIVEWCIPRMSIGSTLVFDDFGFSGCEGVTTFVEEIQADRRFRFIYNLNGHAVLVKVL